MDVSDAFVGIDVSKSELEIGLLPQSQVWKSSNDEEGLSELVKRLVALRPRTVTVMAASGMERPVQGLLKEAGLSVHIVNPHKVRDFAEASIVAAKSDIGDAIILAMYGQSVRPEPWCRKDRQTSELEDLLTRRCQLVEMLAAEKNRLRRSSKRVRWDIQAHIGWLQKRLTQIDNDTNDLIKNMPIWGWKRRTIQIVPGAGPIWTNMLRGLLTEIGGLVGLPQIPSSDP